MLVLLRQVSFLEQTGVILDVLGLKACRLILTGGGIHLEDKQCRLPL